MPEGINKKVINKNSSLLVGVGIDKDGIVNYEETGHPLPGIVLRIPNEVFDIVTKDLDNLPENNETLKFKQGEYINLAINSQNKVRYQVLDAKKGHYLIGKVDLDLSKTEADFFTSKETKDSENPELIVCSSNELEQWINNTMQN